MLTAGRVALALIVVWLWYGEPVHAQEPGGMSLLGQEQQSAAEPAAEPRPADAPAGAPPPERFRVKVLTRGDGRTRVETDALVATSGRTWSV